MAYANKYGSKCSEPEGYSNAMQTLIKSLDKTQREYYFDFVSKSFEYEQMQITQAFRYILEIMCPDH